MFGVEALSKIARWDAKKLVQVAAKGDREAYSYYREAAGSLWEKPSQKYTSAETSINSKKLPSVFSKITKRGWHNGVNIDIGGGKFDNVDEWMQQNGLGRNRVYDPFNRSEEHNKKVLNEIKEKGGADSATISNVLNVIAEPENRTKVLKQAYNAVKPDGTVYISVYEGSGDGKPKESTKGWQENRKILSYVEEVKNVFPSVSVKNGVIEARRSQPKQDSLNSRIDALRDLLAQKYSHATESQPTLA